MWVPARREDGPGLGSLCSRAVEDVLGLLVDLLGGRCGRPSRLGGLGDVGGHDEDEASVPGPQAVGLAHRLEALRGAVDPAQHSLEDRDRPPAYLTRRAQPVGEAPLRARG